MIPESAGLVLVPKGWELRLQLATALFDYADGRGTTSLRLPSGESKIPELVISMALRHTIPGSAAKVRCVIVVEHRNIKFMLQAKMVAWSPKFANVFFVLVSISFSLPLPLFPLPSVHEGPFQALADSSRFSRGPVSPQRDASVVSSFHPLIPRRHSLV